MIRLGLECAFVFMLPAMVYFGYRYLMGAAIDASTGQAKSTADMLDDAPLGLLFGLGCVLLVATLLAFATLQDDSVDTIYEPAVYKNGRIEQGHPK